jgi:hypothetical protein
VLRIRNRCSTQLNDPRGAWRIFLQAFGQA